ncbi:MAG: DUF3048 domain-containing protein [Oscillospiraceae bacterium]|nr:DUF3048 domain-containing protein [Oscillospiraceae bacterium]
MIDNNTAAWPHSGLEKAYLVYEIIVEAGETRMMALFKGQDVDVIGPTRSARHYFLDYALENDAIFVHFGGSPQARNQISSLGINNIDGIAHDSGRARDESARFWRDRSKRAPHNAYVNTDIINRIAANRGFRMTSQQPSVLNYVAHEVELEDGIEATNVTIPYNSANIIRYVYDEENRVYIRYARNRRQTIGTTGEPLTVKNIIIVFARNTGLDGSGRQDLHNIGTLDGYYITNGRAIRITAEKTDRRSPTIYRDLEGNVIEVNDGNTFIQIVPLNTNIAFI